MKTESESMHQYRLESGFFDKYMKGNGLDIGYAGYVKNAKPVLPTAIGVDMDYPGYDGINLPFEDNSQDYVYSSHCLEHIEDSMFTIEEWMRVTRVGGNVIIIVPHQYLYEKKVVKPSNWNADHKRFYTPSYLLKEVEDSLTPNSYRVRLLQDGDHGFDYSIPANKHSGGQYEIVLVLQKIKLPDWDLL